jgi:ATP-dependent protease ClpP protease subunit
MKFGTLTYEPAGGVSECRSENAGDAEAEGRMPLSRAIPIVAYHTDCSREKARAALVRSDRRHRVRPKTVEGTRVRMTGSMDVAARDFEPNPDRAIWIVGEINEAMENRLRPKILELTAGNRAPITVFIDSMGGNAAAGERILGLLRSTSQDGGTPSRIITVAGSKAQSMAADILSAGDLAFADPGCRLLYHETKISLEEALTADYASAIAELLNNANRAAAASFLDKSADRLLFIISAFRPEFAAVRANANDRTLTDLDCFHKIVFPRVSPAAQGVLLRTAFYWNRRCGLIAQFEEEVAKVRLSSETADVDRIMLDTSIAFEYEKHGAERKWSLRRGGLGNINEHFFFLDAYSRETNGIQFAALAERWAHRVLPKDDLEGLPAEDKAEKFREFFRPFWSFFIALRRALNQEENELTALDALWLGLIDAVRADFTAPRDS